MRPHLTHTLVFGEDRVRIVISSKHLFAASLSLALLLPLAAIAQAQNAQPAQAKPAPPRQEHYDRLTVEITGGEDNKPVENASVYVKYVEERKFFKDKKTELNVKTNRDGVAHVPDAPLGKVLIQIVAEGWKTYGRWYEIKDPNQVIKIHLEKPPHWY
jgi:hypothetical protein